MDLNELLIEFTNKGRYEVFKSLYKEKKRHSELEKELNIPGPEISRNLKRLVKKKLISKTIDNEYEITSIGKILYEILNIFESTLKFEEFLNNHDISSIPIDLFLQFGKLKKVNVNNQTMKNIQKWSDLVKNSEKYILAISDQFQNSILPIVERKINNQSIEIKALIEKAILMDSVKVGKQFKDRHAFYDKVDVFQNVRVLSQIGISLIASDKGAIVFLSKGGKIDYSQCLVDNSEAFVNWTRELFKWYWKKGKKLRPFLKK
ncbi:MAG: winged helix-turn-helix transcriptional regulator [Promethearchaeota archaeon]|nr:MAG: winged helix-turn-helix transcriptional regulator [Candidatus Lokiarchaeota archaeon]